MNAESRSAWDAALDTIKKLRASGHVALLAGGCVRDRLLSRAPKDFDVVTDAVPDRVRQIFPRSRRVGAKFGVILVRKFGYDIEVATFRTDGPYSDGRHPDAVTFGSEVEDAQRRDFTINGLFLDPLEDRVIDHVGGRADLQARIVRAIGDPDRRFGEDHLRMLRAIRFAARLGFAIDSLALDAIKRHARHLQSISAERVWIELEMILTDPSRVCGWTLLVETSLVEHLSPAWPQAGSDDPLVGARLAALPPHPVETPLAMGAVLCCRSSNEVAGICRALRLSNRLTDAVVWMTTSLPVLRREGCLELADLKMLMNETLWPQIVELLRADLIASGGDMGSYDRVLERASRIAPSDVAPPPFVTGTDLCNLGMSPGPRLGEVLKTIYRAQLNGQLASREEALAMAIGSIRD